MPSPKGNRRQQGKKIPQSGPTPPPHFEEPLVFPMCAPSSEKILLGPLPHRLGCLMLRQKKTGTKACTFQKARYASPTSGTAIAIGAYSVKMPMNSGRIDTWTRTESLYLDLSKRTRQDT